MGMTLAQLQKLAGSRIDAPENQMPPPGAINPQASMPMGATTGQGMNEQGPTMGAPAGLPGAGGSATSGNPWDGKSGFALANDPAYIDSQITQGFQQRYGRNPTDQEMQQWRGYAGPDTYSDKKQRQGWNPYLMDRLVNPNSSGGSSVDPGSDTIIGSAPSGGGMMGGFSGGGQSGNPLVPGNLVSPWTQQFHAPDPSQIQNDPAYQFQLKQGQNAIDRSAAARGTLVSGGTLKDMAEFGQGLASNFEDKAYNRAIGEYGMNQNTFRANQNDPFNKMITYGNQGLQGAAALSGYGNSYADRTQLNANQTGDLETGQGNANANAAISKGNLSASTLADLAANLSDADWGAIFGKNTPKPNAQATA